MARLGRARPNRASLLLHRGALPSVYVKTGAAAVVAAGRGPKPITYVKTGAAVLGRASSGARGPSVDAGADVSISLGGTVTITPIEVAGGGAITDRAWRVISGP